MKRLWDALEDHGLSAKKRSILFLILNTLKFALIGLLVWAAASRYWKMGIDWLICFMGYPGFFAGYLRGYSFSGTARSFQRRNKLWTC